MFADTQAKSHLESALFRHFDDTLGGIRSSSKSFKQPLSLPRNPNKSTSRNIINSMKNYLRQRVPEFYAIIPYLHYTMNSFDPKTGLYETTPHISSLAREDEPIKLPKILYNRYKKQSATLYSEILAAIQQAEMAKILAPFKCGLNKQCTSRCYKDDGASCVHALLSKYGRTDAQTISKLEAKFKASPRLFELGSPAKAVASLRTALTEVMERSIPLKASECMTPIVTILGDRFPRFAVKLEPYADLADDQWDCAARLEQLYSEIEAIRWRKLDSVSLLTFSVGFGSKVGLWCSGIRSNFSLGLTSASPT